MTRGPGWIAAEQSADRGADAEDVSLPGVSICVSRESNLEQLALELTGEHEINHPFENRCRFMDHSRGDF